MPGDGNGPGRSQGQSHHVAPRNADDRISDQADQAERKRENNAARCWSWHQCACGYLSDCPLLTRLPVHRADQAERVITGTVTS
jgi:hypothetical protein